jgi:hypothetical protein
MTREEENEMMSQVQRQLESFGTTIIGNNID